MQLNHNIYYVLDMQKLNVQNTETIYKYIMLFDYVKIQPKDPTNTHIWYSKYLLEAIPTSK